MQLWETMLQQRLLKKRSRAFKTDEGTVVKKTLDAEPIIEAVKAQSELQQAQRNQHGMLYLGSVDQYTANNWAKECGHPVGTAGWREYAIKQLKSSNYAQFRAAPVKRYIG